jgi:hypothetical protein
MALEDVDYVTELVKENPPGTDAISQGDNHIRLIKKVLTQSLPDVDQAAATVIVKATAPTTQVKGTIWYDTSADTLKINTATTGATASWVEIGADAPWSTSPAKSSMFKVHRNGSAQSTTGGGTVDQIRWTNADFDLGSEFTLWTSDDDTQSRFTAAAAGKYFFHGNVSEDTGGGADDDLYMYKNGVLVAEMHDFATYDSSYGSVKRTLQISTILDLSADDYVELKYRTEHTNTDIVGAAVSTYFEGYKLV